MAKTRRYLDPRKAYDRTGHKAEIAAEIAAALRYEHDDTLGDLLPGLMASTTERPADGSRPLVDAMPPVGPPATLARLLADVR